MVEVGESAVAEGTSPIPTPNCLRGELFPPSPSPWRNNSPTSKLRTDNPHGELWGISELRFEKELAAEALRRNENDTQKALDDLTNPETNSDLQVKIESRKMKRQKKAKDSAIEKVVQMGFERSRVVAAFEEGGNLEEVLQRLTAQPLAENMQPQVNSTAASDGGGSSSNPLPETASSGIVDLMNEVEDLNEIDERDVEMEDELSADIANGDAFTDYDIEVNIEGEAITEYLSMVETAAITSK
ncbi:NEDD8 ultimate buster 1-like protein [Trifolium pratense]|uniref:NEDD8 ultimate buster 1-like protein n=1 Tax=Trifolium pratense TaxID=57577 RepID=A0A2K3MBJ9_TRIPR|nr:NEDD8 ultimate buster 1-like protein [Trifolium pratense]